jgi:TetR/AcrR family transcriptional repressor of bet genes
MPRPSNTAERRLQIVEALLAVMATHGYDGASIASIAGHARLAPGLVHYHFKNKREILLAAIAVLTERHLAIVDGALASSPDPIAQLAAVIDAHLGTGARADPQALACWVLVGAEALRDRRVRTAYERVLAAFAARLTAVIERGVTGKQFARIDPAAAAAALIATIDGYFVVAASARTIIPAGSAARSMLRMAEGLLQPARPFPSGSSP